MIADKVNSVSFGASLQTALRTPEAKMFMQAGKRFQELTAKNFPNEKLVLKSDFVGSEYPILTLANCNQFITNVSNDFLKFDMAKNSEEVVTKLVKTLKILVEDRKMMARLSSLDTFSDEYNKVALASTSKMKRIAGKDEGLQSFIEAVQIGLNLIV